MCNIVYMCVYVHMHLLVLQAQHINLSPNCQGLAQLQTEIVEITFD